MANLEASALKFRPVWKYVALVIALWLAGCSGVGYLIAAAIGEHGSIVFAGLGLVVGLAGAATHAALLLTNSFVKLTTPKQVLALWLATVAVLVVGALVFWIRPNDPNALSLREALTVISLYAAVPALVAASLFSWLVKRAAA